MPQVSPPMNTSVIERTRVPLNLGMMNFLANVLANALPGPEWIGAEGFKMEPQCHTNWCWAATAEAVARYYHPSTNCTQHTIAKKHIDISDDFDAACYVGKDLDELNADNNLPYNVYGVLASVLWLMGCYAHAEATPDEAAPLENVQQWIDGDVAGRRVVCVRIEWPDGGTHFVVIDGYRPGTQMLHVWDPWGPQEHTIAHKDLATDYTRKHGRWIDTLYTKRSTKEPSTMCAGS